MKKLHTRSFWLGPVLPLGFFLLAAVLTLGGVFLLWTANWVGAGICLALSATLFLLHQGVDVDLEQRRVKPFLLVLGVRWGKWKPLAHTPDMVVLRSTVISPFSMLYSGAQQLTFRDTVYDVYLASPSHLTLIQLRRLRGESNAYQSASTLARQMGVSLVRYNPGQRRPRRKVTAEDIATYYQG